MLDSGVVHQDVHAAELALGVGEHVGDLRWVADIGWMMTDLAAELFHLGDHRRGIAKAVEDQVGPGLGQAQGNAQADAAGRTGDQGGLARKSGCHGNLTQCQWRRTHRSRRTPRGS
ncbi:hypothetical protein D3C76_1522240 [compost metagenome]